MMMPEYASDSEQWASESWYEKGETNRYGSLVPYLECQGQVSYLVQMDGGQMKRKHVDHIREVFAPPAVVTSEVATGPSIVESASRAVP